MKRLIAVVLSAVLVGALVPGSIVSQAESVSKKPFYLVNWDGRAQEYDLPYVYNMPWTYYNRAELKPETERVEVMIGNVSAVADIAKNTKDQLNAQPDGTRYINLMAMQGILTGSVVDAVDMTHGVELGKDWINRFLTEYKRIGGKLDGISLDLEYFHASSYYLNATHYKNGSGNTMIYRQIVNNPVYQTRIRPKLVERGFIFYPTASQTEVKSEIWTVYTNDSQGGNPKSRAIWDQVIAELLVEYMNESTFEPAKKYYPDIIVSDYKTGDTYGWLKGMTHYGSLITGNSVKAGNTSNYNAYDYEPGRAFFGYPSDSNRTNRTKYAKPAAFNEAVYPDSAYGRTLWGINNHKRMLQSTDTGLVNSWITFFNYGQFTNGYSNTPYYSEVILHIGLMSTGTLYGYILKNEVIAKAADSDNPNAVSYDYSLKVVNDLLAELTRVAGASDRKPIVTPASWNDGYILTGAYAGGRNIWRITPDTSKVSLKDFMVKDKAPTFSVGGLTVTFPQGRIIQTGEITETGNCGYWVETPANVMPVVTGSADRYSKSPSFLENFERYEIGRFTSASVKPDNFWNISGSVGIVKSGNGKVLGMNGDATVTNTKVPENITAGDSYAKQQVWEVSVTLPSGNYGALQLLSFGDEDGGIKISNGKVYYDNAGSYQELSGVALTEGTYIVQRRLNFQNGKCNYAVYDASGKKLGSTDNVGIASVGQPVKTISMSTTGTKVAVHLDNYKIYPAGVAADFEVYDAAFGFKVEDTSASRTADTAYRLSWMNATDQYKVAKIYNGSTLVETVEMQPGTDGVATAIVKASASNPAKLSVKLEDGSASGQSNYDNGDFNWNAIGYSLGLAKGKVYAASGNTENPGAAGSEGGAAGDSTDGVVDGTDSNVGGANDSIKPGDTNSSKPGSNQAPGAAQSGNKGLSVGVIALIAVAGVVVLTAGLAVVFWFAVMPRLTEEESPAWLLSLAGKMRSAVEKVKRLFKKKSSNM